MANLIELTQLAMVLIIVTNQQVTCGMLLFDEDESETLPCISNDGNRTTSMETLRALPDHCHLLQLYNQTQVDEMKFENVTQFREMTDRCSCALIALWPLWEDYYNEKPMARVQLMVERTIDQWAENSYQAKMDQAASKGNSKRFDREEMPLDYPPYLWSDVDVTLYGISIHVATSDFFTKLKQKSRYFKMSKTLEDILTEYETYLIIFKICKKISIDKLKLYRYLENLNRISPQAFSKTLANYEVINTVYQASKACKLLLLHKLNGYKLKPDNTMLVPVFDGPILSLDTTEYLDNTPDQVDRVKAVELENVQDAEELMKYSNNLDAMLTDTSAYLLNCKPWQDRKLPLRELEQQCPMMMVESTKNIPINWLTNHTTLLSRSQTAIKCACQLLLHNSTWATIMKDPNVQMMASALTNYMNENRIPNFSSAPIMSLFGWFQHLMSRFEKNRKMSLKEIVKVRYQNQDPTDYLKYDVQDECLELLRRGCNYIMFNHNKGQPGAASELKLIRYLDNLQAMSQDPMFVFHLSLQDANLFKLNALSKMCKPIVS